MDVVEIVTQKVREAVNVMSTQFPALIKGKLNEKADVSAVPTKVSDLTNDSGYQTAQQVEDKIDAKVSGVYRASDSASSVATLPALTKANVGRVCNMLSDFTTTADFVEGAGKTFSAGTNVVVTDSISGGYKYDVLAGFVDLSGKQDKLAVTGAATKGIYVSASGVVSPMTYELNANVPANFAPATAVPLMDGTAAVGTSAKYAREDHRHDTDTSRASAADLIMLVNYIKSMDVDRIASGNPATFSDAKAANVKALSVTITPTQSGSGDPSPDNVRPISGVSSVTITRTGKNLLEITNPGQTLYGVTFTVDAQAGTVTANGTATRNSYFLINTFSYQDDASYIISGCPTGGSYSTFYIHNGVAADEFIDYGNGSAVKTGAELNKDRGQNCYIAIKEGTTCSNLVFRPMIRFADEDSTFEPYRGQTVTVSLTDGANPLTVYGGTLDVTTGNLVVTYRKLTLASGMISSTMPYKAGFPGVWVNGGGTQTEQYPAYNPDNIEWNADYSLCDTVPVVVNPYGKAIRGICLRYTGGIALRLSADEIPNFSDIGDNSNTIEGVSNYLATYPTSLVYRLATPVTYQLTPAQLATLSGYNAVSSDAGPVDVTYKADASIIWGGD